MLLLVVDTNLFHEFRRLEELPWNELGESEETILIVSDPVQTELDEQKKSPHSRIRKRALKWTTRFRKLILADQTDELVNASNPKVIIRLDDTWPSRNYDGVLDLTIADDRLVAIAAALRNANPDQKIALFSDDLRPLRKARQVRLEAIEIPETWRREPELTAEERRIEKLTKELAILSKQEPDLTLRCSVEQPIEFVLPIYEVLSDQQVSEFMEIIKIRYPMENNFERERNLKTLNPFENLVRILPFHEFNAASETDIKRYIEADYPNWLKRCHHHLTMAHDKFSMVAQRMMLSFELVNQGTRPAKDLLITFETSGAIRILPKEKQENEDKECKFEQGVSLPAMPKAPKGEWKTSDLHSSIFDVQHPTPSIQVKPFGQIINEVMKKNRQDRFRYRERPAKPTTSYSLTCEQFRHGEKVKRFDLFVFPEVNSPSMDGKNGVVKVNCGAANLSSPAKINVPIRLVCETLSTYDHIQKIPISKRFTASS